VGTLAERLGGPGPSGAGSALPPGARAGLHTARYLYSPGQGQCTL